MSHFSATVLSRFMLATVLSTAAVSPVFAAEEAKDPFAETLLGDVGGVRGKLGERGVDVNLNYKADYQNNVDGGAKRGGAYLGAATLSVGLDGEKLFGLKGNSANLSIINTHGGKPNSFVGSTQGVNNFEVTTPTTSIYEAWIQQNFLGDKISALIGLRDSNAEFDVTDMSGNFMMPTMQIGQDFAQSGVGGPSVYPVTSLAARLRVNPTPITYLQAAVFDGVPGSRTNAKGTHVHLASRDGTLLVAEAGVTPGNVGDDVSNKFGIGAWTYTKQFADNLTPTQLKKSSGVYALSSYQFYKDTSDRTLGGYARVGAANGAVSQVDVAYEIGAVGRGWVPTRKDGEFGLGVSQAHNSGSYVTATGAGTKRNETSYELYYRDAVCPGITVQPDVQYIVNPGTTAGVDNATVLGLRLDVNF